MPITFTNTFSDILRFACTHQFKNIPTQALYLLFSAFILSSEYSQSGILISLLLSIFFYIFMWILQFAFNAIYLFFRKNKTILTSYTVEIQDESLYVVTPYSRSYFFWKGIVKIIKITGYIAIYVSPERAVLVPNRAFDSIESKNQFFNDLMVKINVA